MTRDPRVMDAVIKAHEALIQLMSIIVRAEWDPDNSGPEDICEPYVEWLIFSAENMAALWPELQERDLRERRRL